MAGTTICADDRDLYEDLPSCRGQKSLPGTRNHMFMIRKANITKWPTRPGDDAATLEDIAKLKGDFELEADKKWLKIELVPNQNNIASERIGTYGSYLSVVHIQLLCQDQKRNRPHLQLKFLMMTAFFSFLSVTGNIDLSETTCLTAMFLLHLQPEVQQKILTLLRSPLHVRTLYQHHSTQEKLRPTMVKSTVQLVKYQ